MPDILGGAYYGNEVLAEDAAGGAQDQVIGYDSEYDQNDGYLNTRTMQGAPVSLFDAFGETIQWGGGSDPYQSPMLSTSDIIRSRDAGIPYPASPINRVPDSQGTSTEKSGWSSLFRGVVDVFGKSAVVLAGSLAAKTLERQIPGKPSSGNTRAGQPLGLPAKPFVLPSFLGGGSFTPSSQNITILMIIGIAVFFLAMFGMKK